MIRIPGKIPVTIHPAFWVVAGLIGYFNALSFVGTLIWIGVIFVSVLVHEFGHALTAALFGLEPKIELVAFGGLTYHQGDKLPFWKQFFIVLDGPLFGFLLFGIATYILPYTSGIWFAIVRPFQWINLIWTILNLLPILPMDGGQLMRIVLEGFFGIKGFKYSLLISAIFALFGSLVFFLYQGFLIGALFFLFAYQSFETWKKMRHISDKDRSDTVKASFEEAEEKFLSGNKSGSLGLFEKVRAEAKRGMIHALATQYIALIKDEEGKTDEAYDLLLSAYDDLTDEAKCILHRLAFQKKNYPLVIKLGGSCYQTLPNAELALRNAYAHAIQKEPEPAIGWLKAAWEQGIDNISEVLNDPIFDPIRQTPPFQQFLKVIK